MVKFVDDDDFVVEDILVKTTKKIKSKNKGNRSELQIVHILNDRFQEFLDLNPKIGKFSRSVGSGNRWGQNVVLSENAKVIFSGDLCCPEGFKFVLESKSGYSDIDIISAFEGHCKGIDEFLKQVLNDAERVKKKPLLIWKKDRKCRIVALLSEDLNFNFKNYMIYKKWTILSLEELLKLPDEFFF